MNARELHDAIAAFHARNPDLHLPAIYGDGNIETILRALDLLARVEESTDELVRELREREEEAQQFGSSTIFQRAAAALVALKAERDALIAKWAPVEAFKATYDKVYDEEEDRRRDFPKDAPFIDGDCIASEVARRTP